LLGAVLLAAAVRAEEVPEKVRLFVLTDIENEPDDAQSMVRLMV
jgi:hypothetical protein